MTIYQIKELTAETSPMYFSENTMKCFRQTLKMFSVKKQPDGRFLISAPCRDRTTNKIICHSQRYFNPLNNKLERN